MESRVPQKDEMNQVERLLFTEDDDWKSVYWCKPVHFRHFVTSREHLGLSPLSPRQYKVIFDFIGEDPMKVFDTSRTKKLAVWLAGKASGKDYWTSLMLAYLYYILLCMVDPHKYFNFPKDENIDIINVATNAKQARKIFFNKFTRRIMNWKWLLANYRVTRRGQKLRNCTGNRMEIRITDTTIESANNIRCNSEHSDAGGYEGYNVLVFVMDEASEFDDKHETVMDGQDVINVGKAQLIYDTLRSSAASRNWPWMGVVISFPRRRDDFTVLLYEEAIKNQHDPSSFMIADRGCTWEFNPRYFGETTFDFEKWQVPMSLKSEFDTDPIGSKMRYCTEPPIVQNAFFADPQRLYDCIDDEIKPLVEAVSEISELIDASGRKIPFVVKKIVATNLVDRTKGYCIHIDLSINGDTTSMVVAHGEPCEIKSTFVDPDGNQRVKTINQAVVVDQILTWEPVRVGAKKANVSHVNIDEIMEQMANLTGLSFLSYDQYQSQYVLEKAMRNGIEVEKHNVKNEDYVLLRNMIYAGAVKFPRHKKLIRELETLIWDGKRVDHVFDSSKDIADALCGVARAIASGLARAKSAMIFNFMDEDPFNPNPKAGLYEMPGVGQGEPLQGFDSYGFL